MRHPRPIRHRQHTVNASRNPGLRAALRRLAWAELFTPFRGYADGGGEFRRRSNVAELTGVVAGGGRAAGETPGGCRGWGNVVWVSCPHAWNRWGNEESGVENWPAGMGGVVHGESATKSVKNTEEHGEFGGQGRLGVSIMSILSIWSMAGIGEMDPMDVMDPTTHDRRAPNANR